MCIRDSYGTVEDAVGRGDMVAVDYRIFRITPHDVRTSCRTVFPGHNHFFCHEGKCYRLVIQRQKRMDGELDLWEGEYTRIAISPCGRAMAVISTSAKTVGGGSARANG